MYVPVHTFDVDTSNRANGEFAPRLEPYSNFHHWGIGTEQQAAAYAQTGVGPPFKTLQQTMEELGHVGRTIDIFKIDCEYCEWDTYPTWLQADLRQILVETHEAPMPKAKQFFLTLHDAGYVIFHKEPNYPSNGNTVEFGFLKLRTDFFVNGTMYANTDL